MPEYGLRKLDSQAPDKIAEVKRHIIGGPVVRFTILIPRLDPQAYFHLQTQMAQNLPAYERPDRDTIRLRFDPTTSQPFFDITTLSNKLIRLSLSYTARQITAHPAAAQTSLAFNVEGVKTVTLPTSAMAAFGLSEDGEGKGKPVNFAVECIFGRRTNATQLPLVHLPPKAHSATFQYIKGWLYRQAEISVDETGRET